MNKDFAGKLILFVGVSLLLLLSFCAFAEDDMITIAESLDGGAPNTKAHNESITNQEAETAPAPDQEAESTPAPDPEPESTPAPDQEVETAPAPDQEAESTPAPDQEPETIPAPESTLEIPTEVISEAQEDLSEKEQTCEEEKPSDVNVSETIDSEIAAESATPVFESIPKTEPGSSAESNSISYEETEAIIAEAAAQTPEAETSTEEATETVPAKTQDITTDSRPENNQKPITNPEEVADGDPEEKDSAQPTSLPADLSASKLHDESSPEVISESQNESNDAEEKTESKEELVVIEDDDHGSVSAELLEQFNNPESSVRQSSGTVNIVLKSKTVTIGKEITLHAEISGFDSNCRVVWEANDNNEQGWQEIASGIDYSFVLTPDIIDREYRVVIYATS